MKIEWKKTNLEVENDLSCLTEQHQVWHENELELRNPQTIDDVLCTFSPSITSTHVVS